MEVSDRDVERGEVELLVPHGGDLERTERTVFFFRASPGDTLNVIDRVKRAVSVVVSGKYYFMAGRLALDSSSTRLELLCNNAGVPFAGSESRLRMAELGDVSLPNQSFQRLVLRTVGGAAAGELSEATVFTVQVTRFSCGGFSVGFVTNHCVLDGRSAADMFVAIAAVCRYSIHTGHGRRRPPQIDYMHNEYTEQSNGGGAALPPSSFTSPGRSSAAAAGRQDELCYRVFPFSGDDIRRLKDRAAAGDGRSSTFEALVAHIWRARTRAVLRRPEEASTVVFAVDVRSRMSPPLPEGFVVENPISFCAEKVREAVGRVTDRYVRSAVDWLEVHRGVPATGAGGSSSPPGGSSLPRAGLRARPAGLRGPVASPMEEFVLLLHGGAAAHGAESASG
ncbi:unnamed protein product [Spirodela intermedia]|uniref:Uncharacterized protein n=1 Tax=Spirodela intermedia TaxID=51605 RepID=A0A7I8J0X1_SPIIN|nr:unnamed protein product [Spirodela intermedia]CAA6663453.1 unnamed protein product [Spirodela intermedia]